MKKLSVIIVVVLLCLVSVADAGAKQRTSKNIRQQQRQTEQKIKQTDAQIKENARQLKSKLNDLNKLRAESQTIGSSIATLQASIDSLDAVAKTARDSVAHLDGKLNELKDAYADILRNARRSRMSLNNLAFIFSSNSFSQAFRRANALKQFTRWRERKVGQIRSLRARLEERQRYVDTLMTKQRALASSMSARQVELRRSADETDKLVTSLKGKETDLKRLLREQQQQATALDRELDKIIKEEQRKAALEEQKRKEEERRKAEEQRKAEERRKAEEKKRAEEQQRKDAAKPAPKTDNAPKAKNTPAEPVKTAPAKPAGPKPAESKSAPAKSQSPVLASNFAANKGRLSYPVSPHTIVKHFGRQQHPIHKNVMVDNAGIDMETSRGATVKCVFDGEVSAIFCPDGYNNVVLVRHGQYLTVYANLGTLSVHKGDKVKTGQALGTVYVDTADNDRSILHFEIRNAANAQSVTKENPESWLR